MSEWNTVPDFLSSFILSQRIKELESCAKRESDDLSALAKLVGRIEKRSQWLQKRIRTQRRKTVVSERGLALARSYLAAAQIREYVANWVSKQRAANVAALPVAELERNVARLVGEMVAIVEQFLKTRDDGTSELPTSPLSTSGSESESEPEPESAIEDLLDDEIAGIGQDR